MNVETTLAAGQQAVPTARSRFAREVRLFPWLLFAPTISYLVLLTIFPLLYSLGISLFETNIGADSRFVGLHNYGSLLTSGEFWHAMWITLLITVVAVCAELLLGLGGALVLNRRLPGINVFRLIVYLPMMLSPLVIGFFWRFMFDASFGVINWFVGLVGLGPYAWLIEPELALAAIIVVDTWQWTPFVILLMLAGLQTVPAQLYEAASLERASAWLQFRRITLPYLQAPLLLAVLFRTIDTVKIFDSIFIMTGGGPGDFTQSVSVMTFKIGFQYSKTGEAAALSWLIVIVINVLTTVLIRALTRRRRAVASPA